MFKCEQHVKCFVCFFSKNEIYLFKYLSKFSNADFTCGGEGPRHFTRGLGLEEYPPKKTPSQAVPIQRPPPQGATPKDLHPRRVTPRNTTTGGTPKDLHPSAVRPQSPPSTGGSPRSPPPKTGATATDIATATLTSKNSKNN